MPCQAIDERSLMPRLSLGPAASGGRGCYAPELPMAYPFAPCLQNQIDIGQAKHPQALNQAIELRSPKLRSMIYHLMPHTTDLARIDMPEPIDLNPQAMIPQADFEGR